MYSMLFLTTAALLLSLLLTPLVRDWSIRLGMVDRPDQRRKLHAKITPRTGGVPILLAYAGAYASLLMLPLYGSGMVESHMPAIWELMPPVVLAFLTGLADDWLNLRPWHKLAGQLAAATWAWAEGVRISGVFGFEVEPWLSLVLTVGWLILCCNAFNLIDGVDGLAAGAGLTATLTIFVAGLLHGDYMLALATAPLAGCLIGFLRYNFNPASIFLGDSGSLLLGFLLGCYGVIWSQKSAAALGLLAPVLALSLPLLEVTLSIARRFLRAEPIFEGDRGHIHHRLLDRGFGPKRVALVLYAVCGVAAALSLLQSWSHSFSGVVILVFAVGAFIAIRYLGYVEFVATRRFLWAGLRPMLRAHVQLETLERRLAAAHTAYACWTAIQDAGRALGYQHMTARMGDEVYAHTGDRERRGEAFWQMRLNLAADCWVNITQQHGAAEQPALVIAFAELMRRVLPQRLEELGVIAGQVPVVGAVHAWPQNSRTRTVISSDCGAAPVNVATAS